MKERNEKKAKIAGSAGISPELVEQAKAGDQAAFAELYELTSAELYRTVRAMVRDEDLAWDILQDSYVRAWRGLDKLEASEVFLPWLRRIAVNVTATQMAQKRTLTFTELAADEDAGEPDIPDLSIDSQPELSLDRKETSRLVREILAGLPEEQQLIVGMHYYEDMPISEIASTLHIAVGTVKAQLFKGRKKVEAGVRALEAKGVKLYGLSPLPFLIALLRRLEPARQAEKKALAVVLSEASAAGTVKTVTAMTAGQALLKGLGVKLLAGGLAVAVLVGGKLGYDALKKGNQTRVGIFEPSTVEAAPEELSSEPETTLPELQESTTEAAALTEPSPIITEAVVSPPEETGDVYAGDCGVSLGWSFDPDAGVLTLEGSGTMYDYGARATLGADPPWASYRENITGIRFPEGITSVGAEAFRGCVALTEATIPAGVTVIGDAAFSGCKSLAAVTIPDGLVSLGAKAFYDCDSLLTVRLPKSLTIFGANVFAECDQLVSAVLPKRSFELADGAFANCPRLSFLRIPEHVTAIGSGAFRDCGELTAVVIPEDTNAIGRQAFQQCGSLTSAVILNSVAAIDDDAFEGCKNLTIYGYSFSTASIYAREKEIPFQSLEDLGQEPVPGYRGDLSFLEEADSGWKTETIRNGVWIARTLNLYQDGSFYYREGELFTRSSRYLDGVWQAEEDGTLLLTFWTSPYSGWNRPETYRPTAADAPADSRTARFSCERTEEGLCLRQQYEQGFFDDAGTRLEFRPAEQTIPTLSVEELRALEEEEAAEWEGLIQNQDASELKGYRGWVGIHGIARAGEGYAARVVRSTALTISEAELSQAKRTARITLLGQEYFYGAGPEEKYGFVCKYRPNGRLNWEDENYLVTQVGDRYCFLREAGGTISRIEAPAEYYWLLLEADTPIIVNSKEPDLPRTLEEWGGTDDWSCAPMWDETTGELCLWIEAN